MFENYHFSENAKIVSKKIPGKKSLELLSEQEILESKNRSYPRGIPIAFEFAKGSTIKDVDGNIFIDFFSGCGVLNLGHNNPDILKDLKGLDDTIMHALDFPTKIKIDFMRELLGLLPSKMKGKYKINFGGPTGSDAVEAAIKLAKINTGRNTIISFQGGYHGMTAGALSVTSKLNHKKQGNPFNSEVHFMPYGSCYRCPLKMNSKKCNSECINFIQSVLESPHSGVNKPAALIIEPIQGEGGIYVPSKGWLEKITDMAKKNGIIVIFDEIQSGFYRTGNLFSFEHTGAVPDIITMSKGIGGIGYPLSLIILDKKLDTWESGTHIGTFRGNQLAMTAGLSAFKFIKKFKLQKHIKGMEKVILRELCSIQKKSKYMGDIRGKGMMFGVEYVKDKKSKKPFPEMAERVRRICYKNGLLVEIAGYHNNVVKILPPLISTQKILENGLSIFKKANSLAEK